MYLPLNYVHLEKQMICSGNKVANKLFLCDLYYIHFTLPASLHVPNFNSSRDPDWLIMNSCDSHSFQSINI